MKPLGDRRRESPEAETFQGEVGDKTSSLGFPGEAKTPHPRNRSARFGGEVQGGFMSSRAKEELEG